MANEELKAQNLENVLRTAYDLFLQHGIELVTKEMISRESGLSRRSIDRYFDGKTDCVVSTAQWFLRRMSQDYAKRYPAVYFTEGRYTGAQLLEMYMTDLKDMFMEEPRHFALYSEFKLYIYRNCKKDEQGYTLLVNWLGNRNLRHKIYELGQRDGSLKVDVDPYTEEEYFCESFFGFLANLAVSFPVHSKRETENQITQRIRNTIALYSRGIDFQKEA